MIRLRDDADRTTQWEAWWNANRELFFIIPRKKFKEDEGKGGSVMKYGDQVRKMAIEALVKATKDDDRATRLQAVIALGKVGGKDETKHMLAALEQDKAREVRVTAWLAIGLLGDRSVAPKLIAMLHNLREDEITRTYAAIALGFIGDPKHTPELKKVLGRNDQMGVQLGALLGLAAIKHKDSAELLGQVLANPKRHKLMRSVAAYGLGRQDSKEAGPWLGKALALRKDDVAVTQAIALALGGLEGKEVVRSLRYLVVKNRDDYTRAFALLSLARRRDPKQTEFLIEGLKKAPYRIRSFVALALGIQGDKKGIEPLRKYMKQFRNNDSYYAAGAIALGLLKDKAFLPEMLAKMAKSKSQNFLPYAATAAGLAGDKQSIPGLLALFKDQARYDAIRQMTTISLLKLESKAPLAILPKDLKEGNTFERRASAAGIGETADRALVEALCKELTAGDDKRVRAAAATALGNLVDKSLEHGTVRQMAFSYNYRITPLNRSLWHVFAIP